MPAMTFIVRAAWKAALPGASSGRSTSRKRPWERQHIAGSLADSNVHAAVSIARSETLFFRYVRKFIVGTARNNRVRYFSSGFAEVGNK